MARRGRKPTPRALKIARGNPGKRAIRDDEPQLPPADLARPRGLTGLALQEWRRIGPPLVKAGVLTAGDVTCFETYCRIVGDEARYEKLVAKASADIPQQLRYARMLLKIRGQKKQYMTELGLTPSSRPGIRAIRPSEARDARLQRYFPALATTLKIQDGGQANTARVSPGASDDEDESHG